MPWKMDDSRPIYMQIMEIIQMDIVSGKYAPGDKLPSVRDLAMQASVNPNTMQKALAELEQVELVYSQRTSGRFITSDQMKIQSLKLQLAETFTAQYLANMKQIGFDNTELSSFIIEKVKGETQ
jgi:Predicted transcriptional regulators